MKINEILTEQQGVSEGFNDAAQMVFNGIAMYGFFMLLFRWFKNKALSPDERLGLNRDLSSGWNRVYKVYINGNDVSSKVLTKNEAFEVIKSLAKETHDPSTYFTIYNTDTKKIEFRHSVGTGKSIDEQGVAEGLDEMDKSAPQPGRDGRVSHSTYGSRDKKGSDYFKGKEAPGKPVTKKKMAKDALDILKKSGVAEGQKR